MRFQQHVNNLLCAWEPEVDSGHLSQSFFSLLFERGSLTELKAL